MSIEDIRAEGKAMSTNEEFIKHVTLLAESVSDFHTRFEIVPSSVDNLENMKFRNQLLTEEVGEVAKALNHGDYEQAVAESVDVAYVALGTLLSHAPVAFVHIMEVLAKNAAKTRDTHMLDWGGKVVRLKTKVCSNCNGKGFNVTGYCLTCDSTGKVVPRRAQTKTEFESEQEAYERGG